MGFAFDRSDEATGILCRLCSVDVVSMVVAMRERDHGCQEDKCLDLFL